MCKTWGRIPIRIGIKLESGIRIHNTGKCECLKCGEVHPAPLLLQLLLYLGKEQFAAVKQNYYYKNVRMSKLTARTLLQSARIFSRRSPAPSSSDSSRFS
jgi:hypothetical protein